MTGVRDGFNLDGIPLVRLESDHLRVDVAPGVGGRVVSLIGKTSGHEFLWRNRSLPLKPLPPGAEYDPNFFGGIDELLPNDIPETINGVNCPDHGELWTTPLEWEIEGDRLKLCGSLPRFGLEYQREMSLRRGSPQLDSSYRITNRSGRPRQFLWKLHAAVAIEPGDLIECPARQGQVVDLAWSRYRTLAPFGWPTIDGQAANVIPPADGTVDFFYLFDLASGELGWRRPGKGLKLAYHFDTEVFPYAWMFASYGGFDGHYTVVLEPCTTMPISVNAAVAKKQSAQLAPNESLTTTVTLFAGTGGSGPRHE